jgi:hypothetical protein
MTKIPYIGTDYHLSSFSIAVMVDGEEEPCQMIHLKNDDRIIRKYMSKISKSFHIKACYEASTNGYSFQREMTAWGYHCDAIAPSLIPRKPGNHRKNDFRDARDLAQNYAHGMLSLVHLLSEEEESVRGLVRSRYAFKDTVKRVKHQINSFLLGQDFRWKASKGTHQHSGDLCSLGKRFRENKQVKSFNIFGDLPRVLKDRCDISPAGEMTVKAVKEVASSSLQHLSDSDVGYHGNNGQGCQVQVMETYCARLDDIGVNLFMAARAKRAPNAPKPPRGPPCNTSAPLFSLRKSFSKPEALAQWYFQYGD